MKKILAIILSIAMLFGVLAINTSAEELPTVTLVTNEGSPVAEGVHTYLTVNFKNFSSIKGMDVTITADGAELGKVDVTGFNKLVDNENFTKVNTADKHEIHIVDLTGGAKNGKITFEVTAPKASAAITVKGDYAKDGKTLFEINTEAGKIEVIEKVVAAPAVPEGTTATEENPVTVTQPKAEEGQKPTKFIPYGSVYKVETNGKITYAEKDSNGNFSVTDNNFVVDTFDVPENGITTFGVSENTTESTAVRFGSYSQNVKDAKFHGTMVFEGNWLALKNYYIKNGYSVQELIDMIYADFDTATAKSGKRFVYYNVPTDNGTTKVSVYKFIQTKHMWQDEDNGILEYALRITNTKYGETYTAVAYSEDANGNATISADVKSVKRPAAAQ